MKSTQHESEHARTEHEIEEKRVTPRGDTHHETWITPDFVEVSTCAEICAYIFTA